MTIILGIIQNRMRTMSRIIREKNISWFIWDNCKLKIDILVDLIPTMSYIWGYLLNIHLNVTIKDALKKYPHIVRGVQTDRFEFQSFGSFVRNFLFS
jgi:hypothetical protein